MVAILFILLNPFGQAVCHEIALIKPTAGRYNLPNCTIDHMMQDTTGYLWIATTCGLFRYDGYVFREYRHEPENPNSLSHNRIKYLLQDHAGVIWVGTQGGGLNRYNPEQDNFNPLQIQTKNGDVETMDGRVTSMLEDRSGRIWIGSFEGLRVLNQGRSEFESNFLEPGSPDIFENEWIQALYEDAEGFIWVATRWKGLYRYDPTTRRFEVVQENFLSGESSASYGIIASLFEDSSHYLWIGTRSRGMYRLNPGRTDMVRIPIKPDRKRIAVRTILEDTDRRVWVATSSGLFAWDLDPDGLLENSFSSADPSRVMSGNIRTIRFDSFGLLWIAFFDGGLNHINLESQRHFQSYDFSTIGGGSVQNVTSICEDVLGRIWIMTDGFDDFVWILSPKTREFRRISLRKWIPDNAGNLKALAADKNGFVWVLSDKKTILQIDPFENRMTRKISLEDLSPGFPDLSTNPFLFMDTKNRVWIRNMEQLLGPFSSTMATSQPLVTRARQGKVFQSGTQALFNSRVILAYEGATTGIWIITGDGRIYRYDEKEDEYSLYSLSATSNDCIENITIFDLYEDREGWIWVATDMGLMKLDADKHQIIESYNNQDGLPHDVIKGIVQDGAGDLWLGTLDGLTKFELKKGLFVRFGITEAFFQHPVMRVSSGRALKSVSGQIYFTSRNGMVAFDPATIKAQSVPPQVVINDIQIYEKNTARVSSKPSIINSSQQWQRGRPLVLPFYRNAIQIEYSGIHFTFPEQNQYAVMLEGEETDWRYVASKRSVTYANLSPGKYVFRVKAANSHGVWNETGAFLDFEVLKPYWMTWWFMVSAGSVFILFLVVVLKIQENRSQKQKRFLEIKVAERTCALEDSRKSLQKQERLETLARMRRLQEDIANVSEHERKRVGQMFHEDLSPHLMGTEALMHVLVSQLEKELPEKVTFAKKIEGLIHGGIDKARNLAHGLAPRLIVKRSLREVLEELAEFTSTTFNISCNLHIQGTEDIANQDDRVHIFYIVQEAVYNAVKHADANHIQIHLRVEKSCLGELTISDNGSGFVEKSGKRGMGLRIMKIRAQALGASLEIQKKHEGRTQIRVVATKEAQP